MPQNDVPHNNNVPTRLAHNVILLNAFNTIASLTVSFLGPIKILRLKNSSLSSLSLKILKLFSSLSVITSVRTPPK